MHGIILRELKKYAESVLGKEAWVDVLRELDLEGKVYLPVQHYPDQELVDLATAVARRNNVAVDAVFQELGEFLVPDLVKVYSSLIDSTWKTLDLIEHTEEMIHHIVRQRDPSANPPRLVTRRKSASTIELTYASERKLCGIAKGIVRGVAKLYGERIELRETACMHEGAPACVLVLSNR